MENNTKEVHIITKIKPENLSQKALEITENFLVNKNRRYFGIARSGFK